MSNEQYQAMTVGQLREKLAGHRKSEPVMTQIAGGDGTTIPMHMDVEPFMGLKGKGVVLSMTHPKMQTLNPKKKAPAEASSE